METFNGIDTFFARYNAVEDHLSVGQFISNGDRTDRRVWGPSAVDTFSKQMFWVDQNGQLFRIDTAKGLVSPVKLNYPETPKIVIVQLAVMPTNTTKNNFYAIMATPDALEQRVWLESVPFKPANNQPRRLFIFRFRLSDMKSAPITTIDPFTRRMYVYIRLIHEDNDLIYTLKIDETDTYAVLLDVEPVSQSNVIMGMTYDQETKRVWALIQQPLVIGGRRLKQGPLGSMLAVYSSKYDIRSVTWEQEFIVEGLEITSRLVHASFTFATFNSTNVKPDRFLNILYEDNTVVTIDMYTRQPVVNLRPYEKLEALGLIARDKP